MSKTIVSDLSTYDVRNRRGTNVLRNFILHNQLRRTAENRIRVAQHFYISQQTVFLGEIDAAFIAAERYAQQHRDDQRKIKNKTNVTSVSGKNRLHHLSIILSFCLLLLNMPDKLWSLFFGYLILSPSRIDHLAELCNRFLRWHQLTEKNRFHNMSGILSNHFGILIASWFSFNFFFQ